MHTCPAWVLSTALLPESMGSAHVLRFRDSEPLPERAMEGKKKGERTKCTAAAGQAKPWGDCQGGSKSDRLSSCFQVTSSWTDLLPRGVGAGGGRGRPGLHPCSQRTEIGFSFSRLTCSSRPFSPWYSCPIQGSEDLVTPSVTPEPGISYTPLKIQPLLAPDSSGARK